MTCSGIKAKSNIVIHNEDISDDGHQILGGGGGGRYRVKPRST